VAVVNPENGKARLRLSVSALIVGEVQSPSCPRSAPAGYSALWTLT
jgi:hypothetical protein